MSLNRYAWVEGNVPNASDPSGKSILLANLFNSTLCSLANISAFQQNPCCVTYISYFPVPRYQEICWCDVVPSPDSPFNIDANQLPSLEDLFYSLLSTINSLPVYVGGVGLISQPQQGSTESTHRETLVRAINDQRSRALDAALGFESVPGKPLMLLQFAANLTDETRIAIPWYFWTDLGWTTKTESELRNITAKAFRRVVTPILLNQANHIHVNLEGIEDIDDFIDEVDQAYEDASPYSAFGMELLIIRDFELCHKTTFYGNGSQERPPIATTPPMEICG
jgi:hypothetical protein